jgi:hypothetical protein
MKKNRFLTPLIVLVLSALVFAIPVLALPITLDGDWSDWNGALPLYDTTYDDWNSPQPTDLTEFRAYVTDTGVNLMMGVDDTVVDNQGITMGITFRNSLGNYYRIYVNATGDPPVITNDYLGIYSCGTDAACTTQTEICDGDSKTTAPLCTSVLYAYDDDKQDPWPATTYTTRAKGDCSDAPGDPSYDSDDMDCLNYDLAVEMFVPWTYLGYTTGSPADLSTIFMQYATYPSSPSVATKDFNTNGIYCINPTGADPYNCYPSTPTAIEGLSFSASSKALPTGLALSGLGLVVIGGVLISVYLRRRARSA